jgi:hypothetical protein
MGQACPVSRPANAFHHAVALEGVLFTARDAPAIVDVPIPAQRDRDAEKPKPAQLDASRSPGREKEYLLSH